ncbi:hypothetical protein DFH01_24270 [Falsiroseomonas bella]|uniref:Secreted protein n=1 Tax=Falsiroseomonas bella TaxID=2184016 RepID=A0A317FAY5_9PROT|nr:hypothetical protein [Falsiroseomonas bella]PWS34648.1 hypothetical protein DFH01_24270 [Falsiroseomonas bella]
MHIARSLSALLCGGALLVAAGHASADAIDGDWCTESGLRMTIRGPSLVSPGGAQVNGDYTRHGFSYAAPAGEPGGGGEVRLQLRGDNLMLAEASAGSIERTWRRCGPPTS